MTLQELKYLVALATHRHFRRAAEACHVSQPTLSIQIKKLEEALGITLIERSGRVVELTTQGREVVNRARLILDEAQAIREIAKRTSDPLAGPLRLGVIPTLGPYMLPWLIPAVRQRFPKLWLIPHEDLTAPLLEDLKTRRIEAALLSLPLGEEGFAEAPLFDEPFRAVCPADHPLAAQESIASQDLAGERLLLLTEGHCLREQTLALCGGGQGLGFVTETGFRAASIETIRHYVALGMGVTILPVLAAEGGAPEGVVVRPLATPTGRRIGLVWRKTSPYASDMARLSAAICASLPPQVQPLHREEWLEACWRLRPGAGQELAGA